MPKFTKLRDGCLPALSFLSPMAMSGNFEFSIESKFEVEKLRPLPYCDVPEFSTCLLNCSFLEGVDFKFVENHTLAN